MPIAAPKLNQKMMSIYVPSVTLALVVFRQAANGARDRQRHQIPSPPATSVTTVTPACTYVLRTVAKCGFPKSVPIAVISSSTSSRTIGVNSLSS